MRAAVTNTVMETDWDKTRLGMQILELLDEASQEAQKDKGT